MNGNYRADVEGLRAVAVVPIVLFHLDPALCPGGFIGVDIFFVISGYVITTMITAGGEAFKLSDFYIRRVFRLFPALVVTLAMTMLAAWKVLSAGDYVALAKSSLAATLAVSNFYFYSSTDYFTAGALQHPLLHTWSLGVEEQFYLFWPALLIAIRRFAVPPWLGIGTAAAISLVAMLVHRQVDATLVFYMMPFRIFEFAAGALLAMYPCIETRSSPTIKFALGCLGIFMLSASLVLIDDRTAWPNVWTLAPTLGTLALIVAGGGAPWGRLLATPPLRLIGRLSYSLYLVHWPIITLYRTYIVADPTTVDLLAMGVASVACAFLLHYGIETPFRIRGGYGRAASLDPASRPFRLVGAAGSAIAMIGLATLTIQAHGFPSRIRQVQNGGEDLTFAGDLCSPKRAICAFGEMTSKDVVYLVGDSHALNLVFGLDELFREHHIKGIALYDHGCLYLSGTTRFIKGVKDNRCAQNVEQAYELLERTSHPVIFAGAYSGYRGDIGSADAQSPLQQTEDEYYDWLGQQLLTSLRRLGASTRPVVVVRQTYDTGVDIAKCLRQPGNPAERCKPRDRTQATNTAKRADDAILALGAIFPRVSILDPKSVFCAKDDCTVREGERLFFRDTTHLTNEGSRFLVRGLSVQLMDILKPEKPAAGGA